MKKFLFGVFIGVVCSIMFSGCNYHNKEKVNLSEAAPSSTATIVSQQGDRHD